MIRRQLRRWTGLLVLLITSQASAAGELGLKEPYEETEYRERLKEEARAARLAEMEDYVADDLPVDEQHAHLQRFTNAVLSAESIRERLRAHADLLAMTESLHDALDAVVRDQRADLAQRTVAVWALGERGSAQACQSVRAAKTSADDPLYMLSLATAQGRCGNPDFLLRVLKRGNDYTRPRAAVTLAMLNMRRARTAIQTAAQQNNDENYEDYYNIAKGLLGDNGVSDDLRALLNHRELHLHAAIALARLHEEYIVFDLLAATRSPEALVRWAAAKELLPITERLAAICDRLERVAADDDTQVMQLHGEVDARCNYD